MTSAGTPAAERHIDDALVRGLLQEQHPDLAALPLELMDTGWDNVMFRLGDEFVVRVPRRSEADPLIEHEQAWLPSLASRLPIPIPAPVRVGLASDVFPWPWSILPWLPGTTADQDAPSADQAAPLANFLLALHQPAPTDAPVNVVRGVPLSDRASSVEERLDRLRAKTDAMTRTVLDVWRGALEAPEATRVHWLHGDLHARNVLVDAGTISGIIDWGDITSGDAATDLASIWMLLDDADARAECLALYAPSPERLARAKGWAVLFGAVLLDTGLVDHPAHAAMGAATLDRLNQDS